MPTFDKKVKLADARVIKATERAILVRVADHDGPDVWIPQSQVDDDSEVWEEGDEGVLVVSEWIAQQKGLA